MITKFFRAILIGMLSIIACTAQANIAEAASHKEVRSECQGDVLVDMNGIKLFVPRNYKFSPIAEARASFQNPKYNCDINLMRNIEMIESNPIGANRLVVINSSAKDAHFETTYDKFQNPIRIDPRRKSVPDQSVILKNGIKKVTYEGFCGNGMCDSYFLPADKESTMNGQPILINCGPYGCESDFFHSNGLFIKYTFQKQDHSDESIIEAELNEIKIVNTFILNGQNSANNH